MRARRIETRHKLRLSDDKVVRARIQSLRKCGEMAESGRMQLTRNQPYLHGYRGFESLSLRHNPI
jgi:DNA-directed RNA polymerase subunit E'/Rpb7